MNLADEAGRDAELAAQVRAAAKILNETIEEAAAAGLIVNLEVREEEPPMVEVTVDKSWTE
jgi:hypothetical protein